MFPLSIVPSLLPPPITLYGWFASTLVVITISSLPPAPPPWSFSIDVILVDVLLVVCNEVLDDFRCNRDFFPPGTTLFWPVFLLFWLLIATVSFLCVWGGLKFPFVDELDDELVWLEPVWRLCFVKNEGKGVSWNKWIDRIEFPRSLICQRMLIVIYHISFYDVNDYIQNIPFIFINKEKFEINSLMLYITPLYIICIWIFYNKW